jgi:outer membrane receptor for ferrienterochelin and colicin
MNYFKNYYSVATKINIFIFIILISFSLNIDGQQRSNLQHTKYRIAASIETSINKNKEVSNKTDLYVTAIDSTAKTPLELVNLILQRNKQTVAMTVTNPQGTGVFHHIESGRYTLLAHYIGYRDYSTNLIVDKTQNDFVIRLKETAIGLKEVVVQGTKAIHVSNYLDIKTGRQIFTGETYHAPPNERMTNLILQNVTGAVKAPTGEMVIRDQHDEYSTSTYYVDGVPIPMGTLGSLNETIDPVVIQRITFYTGSFPAEYGGQSAAVFDIQNRVPPGPFQLNVSTYLGSYLTSNNIPGNKAGSFKSLNSDGQSISISQHAGKFAYFLSGSRQETDRRIDQPVERLFNDHGFDYFIYGKLDYILGSNDYLTSNLSYSRTQTQIPFDSIEGTNYDNQNNYNSFQTISLYHSFSGNLKRSDQILIALYSSERGLNYLTNSMYDQTREFLNDDTTQSYTVDQNRKFNTYGTRIKYTDFASDQFSYAAGFNFSATTAKELFHFKNFQGTGPTNNAGYSSSDFGIFLQAEFYPLESLLLHAGVRYDQHISPSIPMQRQISPRVKLSYFVDESNTIYASYDHLFLPTNVEGLMPVSLLMGDSTTATYPEKDNLYEVGIIHDFETGLTAKLDYFHKDASPGLDDESLGSSSIIINVNIQKVKTSGIELSLSYSKPESPLSGFVNGSIIHAYGQGLISGGFLPSEYSDTPFDLDHDQRLTLAAGLNYQPNDWFVNLTARYGSGLTNGNDDYDFKTGLFDLNQDAHTTPAWIIDLSGGYTFNIQDGHSIQTALYITNLFDHSHLIKGAFFNSAYFEGQRNVVFKITYQM